MIVICFIDIVYLSFYIDFFKNTFLLYIGVILLAIVILIVGLIFARPMWKYAVGVFLGAVTALLQLYNIYDTLDRALDADEGKARSYIAAKSMLRLIIIAAVMVFSYFVLYHHFNFLYSGFCIFSQFR